ncbi:hypothetical protein M2165_004236 [Variovorax sp. TBS-050B]|uniref:YdaS family helix-turn-helix protein n=1 Tax=Variovorax sp. TBS-050B TaxID=2940551 RepID=UPI002475B299|nr:YdaS family helix-turn-helix protein [Variovorax sp. TBS-050B]MDH6594347.1 hypothetical protein [Variovorax sp. TBS-050B]
MKHLQELNLLIDAASAIAGSDAKLALALGASRGNVSDWRKGTRPCPPEHQVLMAAIAGFDAQQVAARALVEKHEGTAMGDKLMRALGKPSLAIGAVGGFVGAVALAIFSMIPLPSSAAPAEHNVHYVK